VASEKSVKEVCMYDDGYLVRKGI